MTEQQLEELGRRVKNFAFLNENSEGKIDTLWGSKSLMGLGGCIVRMVQEAENHNISVNKPFSPGIES